MNIPVLYSYYRSSASYRVRIALNLKKIDYEIRTINLIGNSGTHAPQDYLQINPQGLVPLLIHENNHIAQSMAIIEYLDDVWKDYRLLPDNINTRATARQLAQIICCDIHPLNNLRVLDYLKSPLNIEQNAINDWYCHWIMDGLHAFEKTIEKHNNNYDFCLSDEPGIADLFLVPQLYNARRFGCDTSSFRNLTRIENHCLELPAFVNASPENQPDNPKTGLN